MRKGSLIGWVKWKSRKVGPHRAAIGSSGGGPRSVRGGVRGGGGSGGGTERGEGLARGSPRSGARGYFCCSSWAAVPGASTSWRWRRVTPRAVSAGVGGRDAAFSQRSLWLGVVSSYFPRFFRGMERSSHPGFQDLRLLLPGAPPVHRIELPGGPRSGRDAH